MRDIVIIPTYNERETIADIIAEVFVQVPEVHILVVDDNSSDGTGEIVRGLQKKYPRLNVYTRPEKNGLGSAYISTFKRLIPEVEIRTITTMDADWSHHPRYLPAMLRESGQYDIVVGSRYISGGGTKGWDIKRRILSRGGNIYARFISGVPVNDLTAGFVTFRREILVKLPLDKIHSSGYAYTIESKCHAYYLGARIKEIPVIFEERRAGVSKLSGHIIREGIVAPWRMRFARNTD